jgi:hypothetical protein
MIHHLLPVGSAVRGRESRRDVPLGYAAAAQSHDGEREAQLLRNQIVVFREDVQGPEANVAETNDSDVNGLHGVLKLYNRAQRLLLHTSI